MSKIKYRIKEYEEYTHEYKRNENSKLIMEIAGVRKVYHPQIYDGWWSGWVNLSDYPYYSEEGALTKIENHKKQMSVTLDNKVRYINID